MGRQSSIIKELPISILLETKSRLRAGKQSQLEITEWLKSKGYSVSKSALNRYSARLYGNDARLSIDREMLIKEQKTDLISLFEELEIIRHRESEILAQIMSSTILVKQAEVEDVEIEQN